MRVVKYFSYEGPFLDRECIHIVTFSSNFTEPSGIIGMRRNELQGVRWMNHMQSVK